jgi:hypothetical protein
VTALVTLGGFVLMAVVIVLGTNLIGRATDRSILLGLLTFGATVASSIALVAAYARWLVK